MVTWTPKEGENRRSIYVNRFDDIVRTINVRITYDLYRMPSVVFAFYNYRSHVLIHVVSYYCLNYHKVCVTFGRFYYAKIIYLSVVIQIQIVDACVVVVYATFKFFQIF